MQNSTELRELREEVEARRRAAASPSSERTSSTEIERLRKELKDLEDGERLSRTRKAESKRKETDHLRSLVEETKARKMDISSTWQGLSLVRV
jgi:hypothetical protein